MFKTHYTCLLCAVNEELLVEMTALGRESWGEDWWEIAREGVDEGNDERSRERERRVSNHAMMEYHKNKEVID